MTNVTLLGTGTMGIGMAHALLRADLPLTVWNRNPDKAKGLAGDGARVAADPAEALDRADVVITMLYDADSIRSVLDGPVRAGAFPTSAVWLQTTTVGLAGSRQLADFAVQQNLTYVDAPVLGTKKPAEDGALQVFCAGPPATRGTLDPVLDAIASRVVWVADSPGPASALKLACNAWITAITSATAQSIALAQGLGLDPSLFLQALEAGPQNSPYAQLKGPLMISDDLDDASFGLDNARKDLRFIQSAAAEAGVDSRLVDAVAEQYTTASERGQGERDMAAVIRAYR